MRYPEMRIAVTLVRWVLLAVLILATASFARPTQTAPPTPRQVGTMSELMIKIIYPTSDAILYILTRTPTDQVEWNELQGKALMLAESANLLMSPIHAWDQEQWLEDAKLMLDVGEAAYEAALRKDVDALSELNEPLYQSCVTCHLHYRPDYGKNPKPF